MVSGILIFFSAKGDDLLPPNPSWDKYLYSINVVVVLAMLLSIFAIISGIRIWRRTDMRRITRVKYSLVALACLLLSIIAIHWKLIGPVTRI